MLRMSTAYLLYSFVVLLKVVRISSDPATLHFFLFGYWYVDMGQRKFGDYIKGYNPLFVLGIQTVFKAFAVLRVLEPDVRDFLDWTWTQSCELYAGLCPNFRSYAKLAVILERKQDSRGRGEGCTPI